MSRISWDEIAAITNSIAPGGEENCLAVGGTRIGRRVAVHLLGECTLRDAMNEARAGRMTSEAARSMLSLLKPECVQDWLLEEMLVDSDSAQDGETVSLFAAVVDCESAPKIGRLLLEGGECRMMAAARAITALLWSGCDVSQLARGLMALLPDGAQKEELGRALTESLEDESS